MMRLFGSPPFHLATICRHPMLLTKRAISTFHEKANKISQLQPGLILAKELLSISEQRDLAAIALNFGDAGEKGFWKVNEQGQKVLNQAPTAPHRGRIFDAMSHFPSLISDLCMKILTQASQIDSSIKPIQATHLILLYYQTLSEQPAAGYIPWHQDKDPNDGDEDKPVVSISIGDSCDFLVCNDKPKVSQTQPLSSPANLAHRLLLESGDVLIFGGLSRKIHHGIYTMHERSAPHYLPFRGARLNFTFRFAPDIIGSEDRFSSQRFKSVYHDKP